ncbi:MAG: hypothetical protein AB7S38_09220 [Vulcanimicrobiota bacterium]
MTNETYQQLQLLADQVVVGLDQTFRMPGRRKRPLGLAVLARLAVDHDLAASPSELEQALDRAARRRHRPHTRLLAWVSRAAAALSLSFWALSR